MSYPDPYMKGFMKAMNSEKKGVFVRHLFVDINDGNLSDSIAFSHIAYMFSQMDSEGFTHRTIVEKDGYFWLSLTHSDWWNSCRINKSTIKAVLRRIADRGLIHIKRTQVGTNKNIRALIRPDYERISEALQAQKPGSNQSNGLDKPRSNQSNPLDRFDLALRSNRSDPLDRFDLPPGSNRSNPPYIENIKEVDQEDKKDPERGREEDFAGEVISCEIVSEDNPTRSVSSKGKAEHSPSCQKDPNEDYFPLATSSAAIVPVLATVRPVNPLERQLSRKGIALEDWKHFRGKYFGFVNQVTVFGYGSDENVQFEWAKLVREGWVLDSDFWRGLDLEIDYGMKIYKDSGNAPVPGIVGGARFFKDKRWLQAIDRHENNEKLRTVGLEQRVEKSRQSLYQEGVSKMNAAFEKLRQKIESKNQELEECHDF
jgi:hypothetical protein